MDLIRTILLKLEESDKDVVSGGDLRGLGDPQVIDAHLRMLQGGGFLEQLKSQPMARGITIYHGWRITWEGHEFIEKVRDPEIWRKTKDGAGKIGSWTAKMLGDIASGLIRAEAAKHGLPI